MNYIGGKYKLLQQILPLFPSDIDRFVDLFTGGCDVALNVKAESIICNDIMFYLIDLYQYFQHTPLAEIEYQIAKRIEYYKLSRDNELGYKALRQEYNQTKNIVDFFVLILYSFNHQIRFNSAHEFNTPFGKERSCYNDNIRYNLSRFVDKIQSNNYSFVSGDFESVDFNEMGCDDFIYCDPPYLITVGSYNDGKRGFNGWSADDEIRLLGLLDRLNARGVRFALSNVLTHKGKRNDILGSWLEQRDYIVSYLNKSYANSSYHCADSENKRSEEILVTNYRPTMRVESYMLQL